MTFQIKNVCSFLICIFTAVQDEKYASLLFESIFSGVGRNEENDLQKKNLKKDIFFLKADGCFVIRHPFVM